MLLTTAYAWQMHQDTNMLDSHVQMWQAQADKHIGEGGDNILLSPMIASLYICPDLASHHTSCNMRASPLQSDRSPESCQHTQAGRTPILGVLESDLGSNRSVAHS